MIFAWKWHKGLLYLKKLKHNLALAERMLYFNALMQGKLE